MEKNFLVTKIYGKSEKWVSSNKSYIYNYSPDLNSDQDIQLIFLVYAAYNFGVGI